MTKTFCCNDKIEIIHDWLKVFEPFNVLSGNLWMTWHRVGLEKIQNKWKIMREFFLGASGPLGLAYVKKQEEKTLNIVQPLTSCKRWLVILIPVNCYFLLAVRSLLHDTYYLNLFTWYLLPDTSYLTLFFQFMLTETCYQILATWYT